MRAHLSEVCEPDFWTGDMKLLTLSTHNECSNAVSTVRSISREPSYNMHHLETTQWVVWTRLFAGDMKLLNLLTHDRCGQLVSIVSSISIKTSWNIWHVATTQWDVWTWLWAGTMKVHDACGNLVRLVRCVSLTLSTRFYITDIMNTIWVRTISE